MSSYFDYNIFVEIYTSTKKWLRSLSYKKWVSYHYLRHHHRSKPLPPPHVNITSLPLSTLISTIWTVVTMCLHADYVRLFIWQRSVNWSRILIQFQVLVLYCVLKSTPYTLPVDFLAYPVSRSTITEYAFTAYTI